MTDAYDAQRALDERLRELTELAGGPLMHAMLEPDRAELRFTYGSQDLVIVGVDQAGLATVARALKVGRVTRHGRRGARRWTVTLRPQAERPKPPFPRKGR